MALNPSSATYPYSTTGSPNGFVAGARGDYCQNLVDSTLYQCVTTGNAGSAVWVFVGGYKAGSNITISATGTIASTGGGGGFVGYPSYTHNLDDDPSGTYAIANNLPSEITFTTTGAGAGAVATPDYTMETQHTYLPLTITNSLESTKPFTYLSLTIFPGQSLSLYPTDYTDSTGDLIVIPGPLVVKSSRSSGGNITVTQADNNFIIYSAGNGSLTWTLPSTINLPVNLSTRIVFNATGASTITVTPNSPDTVAGNNGLTDTISITSAGLYYIDLLYAASNSLATWVYNFDAAYAGGGGGAPSDATYFLQSANVGLPNATLMFFSGDSAPNIFQSVSGASAPSSLTGTGNVFYGTVPAGLTGDASSNVNFGFNGPNNLVSGSFNTAMGDFAGAGLGASTNRTTYIGYEAGLLNSAISTTAIGAGACSMYGNTSFSMFFGDGADALAENITNCGAFGYNARIGVSNAVNFGGATAISFGINQQNPAYMLDLQPNVNGDGSIAMPAADAPADSISSGLLWYDPSNNLNFKDTTGRSTVLNRSLSPFVSQILQTTGDITLDGTTGQAVVVGSGSATPSCLMPDPATTDPLKLLAPYYVSCAVTDGTTTYRPLILKNSDGTAVNDIAGNAITMNVGDTWLVYYSGSGVVCIGVFLGNNQFPRNLIQSGCLTGQWYPINGSATIGVQQLQFSWQIVNNSFVIYTLPAYFTSISGATTAIAFKNTSGGLFDATCFPASTATAFIGVNNNNPCYGSITINGSSSAGQIIYYSDTVASDFTANASLPAISICAPL